MPLDLAFLPFATPLDPSAEPAGSVDPLGTLGPAERLVEVLLPGLTARMWRARLLTFCAVASIVADHTVELMGGREDVRLEARLAFERIFVAALARARHAGAVPDEAVRAVPGREKAETARGLREPLTRQNFLKGQAVNGAFGVMARLARRIDLVDENGRPGRHAHAVAEAWADDEELPRLLDTEQGWMRDAVHATRDLVTSGEWKSESQRMSRQLADHLRPDRVGPHERRLLLGLLDGEGTRHRMLQVLRQAQSEYRQQSENSSRGEAEREFLRKSLRPRLGNSPIDGLISDVTATVDAYEVVSGLLLETFDAVRWGLKVRLRPSRSEDVLGDPSVRGHLQRARARLGPAIVQLRRSLVALHARPELDAAALGALTRICDDTEGSVSIATLVDAVLERHERVQREKRKGAWIERSGHWTLLPGERLATEGGPPVHDAYLHPIKLGNAFGLLRDLGQVSGALTDAEG